MATTSSTEVAAALAREHLRKRYCPAHVRVLFIGESPPASGRFFYRANSGLYRAIRDAFAGALPDLEGVDFRDSFRALGCYLVDLCGTPVDRLAPHERKQARLNGELRLSEAIVKLKPQVIVTVVRSISANVNRARRRAGWLGPHVELPYPGRWHHHRTAFLRTLIPVLRREFTTTDFTDGDETETETEVTPENNQQCNKIIDLQPAAGIG